MDNQESIFQLISRLEETGATESRIADSIGSYLEMEARKAQIPYSGHFELTPLCNLDCKMCYVHLNADQFRGCSLLPTNTWKELMQQAIDAGMCKAGLSGGECLTYPGFEELYLFLKRNGVEVSIMTNGVLLNDEHIALFRKYHPYQIQISLYGSSDDGYERVTGHRVFAKVLRNIELIKDANLPLKIAITPSKYMLEDAEATIELAKSFGVAYMVNAGLYAPRENTGRSKNSDDITLDDYIRLFKCAYPCDCREERKCVLEKDLPGADNRDAEYTETGLGCAGGKSLFSISWDGMMHPCGQLSSICADPLHNGFLTAWNDIRSQISTYPKFTKCESCGYKPVCVYCPAKNEMMGSRYVLSDRWCLEAQAMVANELKEIKRDEECD